MEKQLTYTSWNNRGEKFDLRSWNEEHTAMTKGLTLTKDELMKLRDILNDIDFDKYNSLRIRPPLSEWKRLSLWRALRIWGIFRQSVE